MNNRESRIARTVLAVCLSLMLLAPQATLAEDPDSTTYEAVDKYVEEQMGSSNIPGVAVSIVEGGEIAYSQGYGETSTGEAVSDQTLFSIGSTTKSMTALAVMQLVEADLVDLDAPVQEYIPWFRLTDASQSGDVTVRHLLTMTSGIPADAGGDAFRSTEPMSPEEAIRSLQTAEFAHTPGTTFEYVNANYVILGHLIEVVSGQPYGDYVQENIFDPLEMDNTYASLAEAKAAGYAPGHRYWFGQPVAHDVPQSTALVPAGYVISTAEDLSHYLAMYLNDGVYNGRQIISSEMVAEMQHGGVDAGLGPWADGAAAKYAMGWYVGGPWGDGSMIFHPGSSPTFTAMLILDQENGRGVVTLLNSSTEMPLPGAAGSLRVVPTGVMDILVGEEPGNAGLGRFYLIFNLLVFALVAVQSLALVRLARRGVMIDLRPLTLRRAFRFTRSTVPLLWEFGLGIAFLAAPVLVGMSWESIRLWTPDLALMLIVVASLWLVTGGYRAILLVRSIWAIRREHRVRPALSADPEAQRSAV